MGISDVVIFLIRMLMSKIKVLLLRIRGAHIGKRVLLGKVKFHTKAKDISIGDGVVIQNGVSFNRLKHIEIRDYVKINKGVEVKKGREEANLIIGHNSWIGERSIIDCSRDVSIGNNVCVGVNSQIWTHGYFPSISDGYPHKDGNIRLEDGAWLQASCTILPDVTVGQHAIIGAGSVLTKSIPGRVFASGIPCQVVMEDEKQYRKQLSMEEKIEIILKYAIDNIQLKGIKITKQKDKLWVCSLPFFSFYVTYLDNPQVFEPDSPGCIFTWEKNENLKLGNNITLFYLSDNTYTKKGTFHEWVVIRALLDTCALRLLPV